MHYLLIKLFNLKERFYHKITGAEVDLIKNTDLFSNMASRDFEAMCHSVRLVRYLPGEMILREGQEGNTLYIIKEGSVRVFTVDQDLHKIPLARRNKGDYFGEQALLSESNKTRNANIEAIEFTTLIAINEKSLLAHFSKDFTLKKRLSKRGAQQAVEAISLASGFYSHLENLIAEVQNPETIEFSEGEVIFNVGDKADFVYVILQGEIKIMVPEKDSPKFNSIILHKGHIFGELGILENKTRQASAISKSKTRLLRINGAEFKKYLPQHEKVKEILSRLGKMYQIPNRGSVEQFLGISENKKPIITTVYNLEDGRTIVSSRLLDQDVFSMLSLNLPEGNIFQYKGENQIKIHTLNERLTGVETIGPCDFLPEICRMILENETIDKKLLQNFELTGEIPFHKLPSHKMGSDIICDCLSITRETIQNQINNGVRDLPGISMATGACTSCGACRPRVLEMLGQSVWSSGVMKKINRHNSYINSYQITLENSQFNEFIPGQHVLIQIRVGAHWIERPYTISDILSSDGSIRITIKKEPKGYFTGWLFSEAQEEFQITASHPQGNFILKTTDKPVLCFAGGIGITPFITFARFIAQSPLKQRMHLVYTALTQEDFILTDLFDETAKKLPSFTIEYRATNAEGYLEEKEIIEKLSAFEEPEVYICGPEPFIHLIQSALNKVGYSPKKINIEKFVHAGAKI